MQGFQYFSLFALITLIATFSGCTGTTGGPGTTTTAPNYTIIATPTPDVQEQPLDAELNATILEYFSHIDEGRYAEAAALMTNIQTFEPLSPTFIANFTQNNRDYWGDKGQYVHFDSIDILMAETFYDAGLFANSSWKEQYDQRVSKGLLVGVSTTTTFTSPKNADYGFNVPTDTRDEVNWLWVFLIDGKWRIVPGDL